jgi:peptide methionine sulfoxide reductase msrA/msrB
MKKIIIVTLLSAAGLGLTSITTSAEKAPSTPSPISQSIAIATFAGGCFWCTESDFEKLDGVLQVISGYSGGTIKNPTYQQVAAGQTQHTESVQIYYDPSVISYEGLLEKLWRTMDPTDAGGSFVDRGKQYRPAVFYHNDAQKIAVEESLQKLEKSGQFSGTMATEISPFTTFYTAEDYHQDYYLRNPIRYKYYRHGSGRDQFMDKTWGEKRKHDYQQYSDQHSAADVKTTQFVKPSEQYLQSKLTPLQYEVTQKDGTERAFDNSFWDEKREGIYVDIVSGEVLFSSRDKFKSGTGWPSFTRPIAGASIVEKEDNSLFMKRVEVRSKLADSHLGHLFSDGPQPTGQRYCINSASLRFIPKDEMKTQGYADYLSHFSN